MPGVNLDHVYFCKPSDLYWESEALGHQGISTSNTTKSQIANEHSSQRHRTPEGLNPSVQLVPDYRQETARRGHKNDPSPHTYVSDLTTKDLPIMVDLEEQGLCTSTSKKYVNPVTPTGVDDDNFIINKENHSIRTLLNSVPSCLDFDSKSMEFDSYKYKGGKTKYDMGRENDQFNDSEIVPANPSLPQPARDLVIDHQSNEEIPSMQSNRKPKAAPRSTQVISNDKFDQTRNHSEEQKQHHRQISRQPSAPSSHTHVVNEPDDVRSSFRESNHRVSTTPSCDCNSNATFIQETHPTSPAPHSSLSRVQEVSRMSARQAYPAADYYRDEHFGDEYHRDDYSRKVDQNDTEASEIRDPNHYATCK